MKYSHKLLPISEKLELFKKLEQGKNQQRTGRDGKRIEGVGKSWKEQGRDRKGEKTGNRQERDGGGKRVEETERDGNG